MGYSWKRDLPLPLLTKEGENGIAISAFSNRSRSGFQDTIAAIATPPGHGALGIVRISGAQALAIAEKVFLPARRDTALHQQKSHTLRHGWIVRDGQRVDEVVLALYLSPKSYTGEDTVEIIGHGGYATLRAVLDALMENGARMAEPGEFTKRAFLNGKMDLAQAEAVMDLIAAKSEAALQAGMNKLEGGLSRWIRQLREEILGFYAPLEAAIDFPEEQIETMGQEDLEGKMRAAAERAAKLLDAIQGSKVMRDGIRIAILGRPNSGKSSLFNALLLENRALVSEIAGTTRDLLEESVLHRGILLTLSDTAGIRKKGGKLETQGMARSLRMLQQADVNLYLVNRSKSLRSEDRQFIQTELAGKCSLIVFTKADLPEKFSATQCAQMAQPLPYCSVSALTGSGLLELKDKIVSLIEGSRQELRSSATALSANARQAEALNNAKEALENALDSSRQAMSYEVIAMDLSRSLNFLGQITGETADEDLLDTIFSRFCIGK